MPVTPDRFPGDREEEVVRYEPQTGTVILVPGETAYVNGAFLFRDSIGQYDPRSGATGTGDDADSLFNDLNESYDISYTRSFGIPTAVLAHAPGTPSIKIREIDNFSFTNGLLTGMRIRHYAADGSTVVETLTYSAGSWVKT